MAIRFLIIFSGLWFSALTEASEQKLEAVCKQDSQVCLTLAEKMEPSATPGSFEWFSIKLHKIDALFQLIRVKELKQELDLISTYNNLPHRLKLKTYILYTKLHGYHEDTYRVNYYRDKVEQMMQGYDNESATPYMIIEYANFQLYQQEFEKGIKLLLKLEQRFAKSKNTDVKKRIYVNLGNLYFRLEDYDRAREHYQAGIKASNAEQDLQTSVMLQYNVARTFQVTQACERALPLFTQLLEIPDISPSINSLTHFRSAQCQRVLGSNSKALKHLDLIDVTYISDQQKQLMDELRSAVAK